ncbi:MAG: AAA family ATPase [Egibacteraceae bacterium]
MIHQVKVKGYKSLDGASVVFQPLSVIFGPNAAGKSNLLDLLGLVSRMATGPLDAAFEEHRGAPLEAFTFDDTGLKGVQSKRNARFSVELDVFLSDAVVRSVEERIRQAREGLRDSSGRNRYVTERRLRYRVTVEVITATGHLRVMDERLEALKNDWTPTGSRKPFLECLPDQQRILLRVERQGHPSAEQIGQDRTIVSKPLYPPHHPHLVAFREELSRWRFYFLAPTAMREEIPIKEVETLSSTGTDIAAFYNTLKVRNPLQFKAMSNSLAQIVPGLDKLDVERTDQGTLRLIVQERGMPLSSSLISEGTLRVLGMLAITNPLEPLSVVGYEEPENGVHPNRLSMVARFLEVAATRGSTQFILNTHSPILPEHFQFKDGAALIHCRKEGRYTRFEKFLSRTLFAPLAIEEALSEEPARTSLRDRLVRGDFA